MTFREFIKKIKQNNSKNLYLIHGTNDYLKNEALKAVLGIYNTGSAELDFDSFREKANENEIILACETLPFLNENRVVLVYDFPALKTGSQGGEKLLEYFDDISEKTVLIFFMTEKTDKRKRIYKAIKKQGIEAEFGELNESELISWIVFEFLQNGKTALNSQARELINICGHSMFTLKSEITKISSYVEGERIETADIRKVASKSLEYNVFLVHDFLIKKDISKAFKLLAEVLESEKSPFGIMGLIASKFRLLYRGRALLDAGYTSERAIKLMGSHPYAAKIALSECKSFSAVHLRNGINELAELDYKLKSGKADAGIALESVLSKIYMI